MRKIIIIDDNPNRKKPFHEESNNQLDMMKTKGMLTVSDGKELDVQSFKELEEYDLIAIHRTFLINLGVFNDFMDYIKSNNKLLILFSGGTTQNTIQMNGRQLNINFSDFYNERTVSYLVDFCNGLTMTNPLLQLLYGKSWKLTLLLQYRYLLWEYGNAKCIDVQFDKRKEREIRNVLWEDRNYRSFEQLSEEIKVEKNKFQNR